MKRYVIGLNVKDSAELPQAASDIQEFVQILGIASEMEIQVSVNPLLTQPVNTHAIGFHTGDADDSEEYYEEEDE